MKRITVKLANKFSQIFAAKELRIDLEDDATIGDLLNRICDTDAKQKCIFDIDGDLRKDVMLSKNRVFVFHLDRLDTSIKEGDTVDIFYPACMG